jgi:hypothetical protein
MADENQHQSEGESARTSASASPSEIQRQLPQLRLQQTFPALPQMHLQIPYQADSPLSAYTDDSYMTPDSAMQHSHARSKDSNRSRDMEHHGSERSQPPPPPPDYEPMHDYLRALALHNQQRSSRYYSPTSNTFLSPPSRPHTPGHYTVYMPYQDSPSSTRGQQRAVITLSPLSPTNDESAPLNPPSYEELYLQHRCPVQQSRLIELVRQMEDDGTNTAEQICKFVIGLVFVIITVVIIGIIFNWGQPAPSMAVHAVHAENPVSVITEAKKMAAVSKMVGFTHVKTLCGGRCKIPV